MCEIFTLCEPVRERENIDGLVVDLCVCVCERERERKKERLGERERERAMKGSARNLSQFSKIG